MDIRQVTETIAMIEEQNFDVRTITMGISLLDCIDPDIDKAAEKVYNKIVTKAKDLVAVGDEIAAELGVPVLGKMPIEASFADYADKGEFHQVVNTYLEAADNCMPV